MRHRKQRDPGSSKGARSGCELPYKLTSNSRRWVDNLKRNITLRLVAEDFTFADRYCLEMRSNRKTVQVEMKNDVDNDNGASAECVRNQRLAKELIQSNLRKEPRYGDVERGRCNVSIEPSRQVLWIHRLRGVLMDVPKS